MMLQQHMYNGLTLPVDYSIFAQAWTHREDSGLAYGHHGWPTVSMARPDRL